MKNSFKVKMLIREALSIRLIVAEASPLKGAVSNKAVELGLNRHHVRIIVKPVSDDGHKGSARTLTGSPFASLID